MDLGSVTEFVAKRMQQLRAERRWSAQRLADECVSAGFDMLSRGTIAKIESRARKSITVDELYALASAFGVKVSELLPATAPSLPPAPAPPVAAAPSILASLEWPTELVVGNLVPDEGLLDSWRPQLARIERSRLAILASRALGPTVPLPQLERVDNAWGVIELLADLNPGPDGIPPVLAFMYLLAGEIGGDTGAGIAKWVGDQASRLRSGPVFERRTYTGFPVPDQPQLHMTIMLEPDLIDPTRCTMSYWRQDDPTIWPPTLSGVREVGLDELEYQVDEAIMEAEEAWSGQGVSVTLEFVLPRTLLGLPVQRWRKEHASGQPRLLQYDYLVSIRSLERMRTRHWHRVWHARWDSMLKDPTGERLYYSGANEEYPVEAILSDPGWVGMVLAEPPPRHAEPGGPDEYSAALRSGLPVILWHPHARPEDLRDVLDRLLEGDRGFLDLLDRRKLASVPPAQADDSLVRGLVVLWDDPKRVLPGPVK